MRRPRPFLAQRLFELAWSSPQVIAHRMSGSNGAEQTRMVMEKFAAGVESWNAVAAYTFALQRSLWRDLPRFRTWSSYFTSAPLVWTNYLLRAERGLSDATAPYHRRAGANARRLASAARRRREA